MGTLLSTVRRTRAGTITIPTRSTRTFFVPLLECRRVSGEVSLIQTTLAQLDKYGPWTVTPSPRRDTDLQALQARLYADVADLVGDGDGYAFVGRFDNMLAITNGIDHEPHAQFQERVQNRYPVTVILGISMGNATTPAALIATASEALESAGSAQSPDRTEALAGTSADGPAGVLIAHFDVGDATAHLTDVLNAIDVDLAIRRASLELGTSLWTTTTLSYSSSAGTT